MMCGYAISRGVSVRAPPGRAENPSKILRNSGAVFGAILIPFRATLEPQTLQKSVQQFIENVILFGRGSGTPFGWIVGGPTLENGALAYTKRLFSQSLLFRFRTVF